jgi:hypothetical protein
MKQQTVDSNPRKFGRVAVLCNTKLLQAAKMKSSEEPTP